MFALKALMYKNPCLFLEGASGGKTTVGKNVQNVELELSDFVLSNVKPNRKVYFSPFFFLLATTSPSFLWGGNGQ